MLHDMQNLCSLTRDQTHTFCMGSEKSQPLDLLESPKTVIFLKYFLNEKWIFIFTHIFPFPVLLICFHLTFSFFLVNCF